MVSVNNIFMNKTIVCGLDKDNVSNFMSNLIKNAWLDQDIPDGMRDVKGDKTMTLDMLPKDFDVDDVVSGAVKKGILMLDRIGVVGVNLTAWINKIEFSNELRVEIDKANYEKDGKSLLAIVNKSIKEL